MTGGPTHILVADDDTDVRETLVLALEREGFVVSAAHDGEHAWELFTARRPDFAVLDLAMPRLDGLGLTRRIAAAGEPRVPIIMLTGMNHEHDKVVALDLGADDYVVKPCSSREIMARIRAVQRRANPASMPVSTGGLLVDPSTHRVSVDGQSVDVTPTEFTLLWVLVGRAGQVIHTRDIVQRVWNRPVTDDLLRMTIYRLRRKIEPDPAHPRFIRTVPGIGFVLRKA